MHAGTRPSPTAPWPSTSPRRSPRAAPGSPSARRSESTGRRSGSAACTSARSCRAAVGGASSRASGASWCRRCVRPVHGPLRSPSRARPPDAALAQDSMLSTSTTWMRTYNFRYRLAARDPTFKTTLWLYDAAVDELKDRWMVDADGGSLFSCCNIATSEADASSPRQGRRTRRTERSARSRRTSSRSSARPGCMARTIRHGFSCRWMCVVLFSRLRRG